MIVYNNLYRRDYFMGRKLKILEVGNPKLYEISKEVDLKRN